MHLPLFHFWSVEEEALWMSSSVYICDDRAAPSSVRGAVSRCLARRVALTLSWELWWAWEEGWLNTSDTAASLRPISGCSNSRNWQPVHFSAHSIISVPLPCFSSWLSYWSLSLCRCLHPWPQSNSRSVSPTPLLLSDRGDPGDMGAVGYLSWAVPSWSLPPCSPSAGRSAIQTPPYLMEGGACCFMECFLHSELG